VCTAVHEYEESNARRRVARLSVAHDGEILLSEPEDRTERATVALRYDRAFGASV
jgi:hypothetical protein